MLTAVVYPDFDAYPEDFTFKIKFEKAEVKRKWSEWEQNDK